MSLGLLVASENANRQTHMFYKYRYMKSYCLLGTAKSSHNSFVLKYLEYSIKYLKIKTEQKIFDPTFDLTDSRSTLKMCYKLDIWRYSNP